VPLFTSGLVILVLVLVLRIWFCLHHWKTLDELSVGYMQMLWLFAVFSCDGGLA